MSKNKYAADGGKAVEGEKKQRDHTKSGKLAARREQRRLDAIDRQVARVEKLKTAALKAKKKKDAEARVQRALLTLAKVTGGVPHDQLITNSKEVKPET